MWRSIIKIHQLLRYAAPKNYKLAQSKYVSCIFPINLLSQWAAPLLRVNLQIIDNGFVLYCLKNTLPSFSKLKLIFLEETVNLNSYTYWKIVTKHISSRGNVKSALFFQYTKNMDCEFMNFEFICHVSILVPMPTIEFTW